MKLVVKRSPELNADGRDAEDPLAAFASETEISAPAASSATTKRSPPAVRVRIRKGPLARRLAIVMLSVLSLAAAGVVSVREARSRLMRVQGGRVGLMSTPAGATVLVDGSRRGVTPLTLELAAGRHKFSLQSGEITRAFVIEAKRDVDVVLNIDLAAPVKARTGALLVSSEPSGLRVVIDGLSRGTTPATIEGLQPGTHHVFVYGPDGEIERPVVIHAGATGNLHITRFPETIPGSAVGTVTITSPIDVQLFQGGTLVGNSRLARFFLPAGTHKFSAVNEALAFRRDITVEVKAGTTNRIALAVPDGALSVNARPWAEVFVDGKSVGETPLGNYPLAIGTHELLLKHPQLGDRRQTVVVATGRTARVAVDFTK